MRGGIFTTAKLILFGYALYHLFCDWWVICSIYGNFVKNARFCSKIRNILREKLSSKRMRFCQTKVMLRPIMGNPLANIFINDVIILRRSIKCVALAQGEDMAN